MHFKIADDSEGRLVVLSERRGLIKTSGNGIYVSLPDEAGPAGRSVSDVVLHGRIEIDELPENIMCDWSGAYESGEPGFIEHGGPSVGLGVDPLFADIEQATLKWASAYGMADAMRLSRHTPVVCQGASFHSDAENFAQYGFCVVWLSQRDGLDLLFPNVDVRIPLEFGSIVFFDAAQPHGTVFEGYDSWCAQQYQRRAVDFRTRHFLSFDFPIAHPSVVCGLKLNLFSAEAGKHRHERLTVQGQHRTVDSVTGLWRKSP
ncbi:hypothetical protein [Caballeronia sp. LZ035]|uniref:hypothetical protein n=1 Tax=Caballeronia sp. LZ035 TaxID=3038568 RepID=UPI00286462E2|nr:hypothetical protein [Caballeronia sp. LZ035]MDR5763032.1 hypothetical protein [Caballeronia sp. LZ035]